MVKKKYWLRFPEKVAVGNERQSGSFLEQDSTTVPKFAYLRFCPCGKSCWGVPSPNPAYPLRGNKNSVKLPKIFCKYFNTPTLFLPIFELKYEGIFFKFFQKQFRFTPCFSPISERTPRTAERRFTMRKRYNTPHRSRVVKTRMTEEEYATFAERLSAYHMSQAEFIRQAITGAAIRPIITVSPVNDELLAAVGKLTAEYGRIGGNLNQIARTLNEWHSPYPQLAGEVRAAVSDLAALKFEVLQKVGDAVGNIQTYQL